MEDAASPAVVRDPKLRMRVLVVDPDPDVREVVEDLLSDVDLEVRSTGDAEAAARALDVEPFDALLCHLPMLRAHGNLLIRRAHARGPKLRVVAMTAGDGLASHAEADANLAKPFSRAELLAGLQLR